MEAEGNNEEGEKEVRMGRLEEMRVTEVGKMIREREKRREDARNWKTKMKGLKRG